MESSKSRSPSPRSVAWALIDLALAAGVYGRTGRVRRRILLRRRIERASLFHIVTASDIGDFFVGQRASARGLRHHERLHVILSWVELPRMIGTTRLSRRQPEVFFLGLIFHPDLAAAGYVWRPPHQSIARIYECEK